MQPRKVTESFGVRRPSGTRNISICCAFLLAVSLASITLGQSTTSTTAARDPGVRGGTVDSGEPLASVAQTAGLPSYFTDGQSRFEEIESVQNGVNNGLGPRFNSNQCSSCHSQPAIGGTSPSTTAFPFIGPNPETLVTSENPTQNPFPS